MVDGIENLMLILFRRVWVGEKKKDDIIYISLITHIFFELEKSSFDYM